jgi:hypothetical protein
MNMIASTAAVSTAASIVTAQPDDSALLKLEEQILQEHEAAMAFDPEMIRLQEIWTTEWKRLNHAFYAGQSELTKEEIWERVKAMPESKEHTRLGKLQDPFYNRMDALVEQMRATPAHAAEGRRAKVIVLLRCVMGHEWLGVDEEIEHLGRMARDLLIELVGGEPGEQLRDQFA